MAKDILKEAIADAKAVREVALANAKAALEEAFTPKLQSMLSAKLSSELNENEEEEEVELDEDVDMAYDEDVDLEPTTMQFESEEDLDEEIDLEAILNELELDDEDSEEVDEEVFDIQEGVCTTCNEANEDFDLDLLLQEINDLEDEEPLEEDDGSGKPPKPGTSPKLKCCECKDKVLVNQKKCPKSCPEIKCGESPKKPGTPPTQGDQATESLKFELNETKIAYNRVKSELNEVNLLNSKLLYVNRIFKANNLDDVQKLRVVETLDKAESVKEAKLIYETIKDTFTISTKKKTTPKKSIREGLGMASKQSGTTQSSARKKSVISESNDMVARFKKLANIKINQ